MLFQRFSKETQKKIEPDLRNKIVNSIDLSVGNKITNYMKQLDLRNIIVKRPIHDQLNCAILLTIH